MGEKGRMTGGWDRSRGNHLESHQDCVCDRVCYNLASADLPARLLSPLPSLSCSRPVCQPHFTFPVPKQITLSVTSTSLPITGPLPWDTLPLQLLIINLLKPQPRCHYSWKVFLEISIPNLTKHLQILHTQSSRPGKPLAGRPQDPGQAT